MVMVLKYTGIEKLITDADLSTALTIGRDATYSITLKAGYASRSHARLSSNRGQFILTDHNSYGTYYPLQRQGRSVSAPRIHPSDGRWLYQPG